MADRAPLGGRLVRSGRGFAVLRFSHGLLRRAVEADVHFRCSLRHVLPCQPPVLDRAPVGPQLHRVLAGIQIERAGGDAPGGAGGLRVLARKAPVEAAAAVRRRLALFRGAGARPVAPPRRRLCVRLHSGRSRAHGELLFGPHLPAAIRRPAGVASGRMAPGPSSVVRRRRGGGAVRAAGVPSRPPFQCLHLRSARRPGAGHDGESRCPAAARW